MNMLGCLDSPTSGKYILNGQDVSRLDDDALADIRNREIEIVFQTFNLLPRYTAVENVALPMIYGGFSKAERREGPRSAHPSRAWRPDGPQAQRTQRRTTPTGGGRPCFGHETVHHLADEPTGNLDTATLLEVMQLFSDIQKAGNTVILVTTRKHRRMRPPDGAPATARWKATFDLPFCVLRAGALERCLLLLQMP